MLMAPLRRHLASLGLAVALCQIVIQVLAPAALCCQMPLLGAEAKADAHECCPAGSHPGQVCPMHAGRVAGKSAGKSDCAARPVVDLHDMLMTLSSGGVLPSLVHVAQPTGSEATPLVAEVRPSFVASPPPGPPPRA
jgi:hypothetical protein